MAIGDILVDVQAVAKHYGEGETRVDALRQVDLQVRAGEVIALLGPSGSGKTTLLNIIGCILDPSSGRVVLDGDPVPPDHGFACRVLTRWVHRKEGPPQRGRLEARVRQLRAARRDGREP